MSVVLLLSLPDWKIEAKVSCHVPTAGLEPRTNSGRTCLTTVPKQPDNKEASKLIVGALQVGRGEQGRTEGQRDGESLAGSLCS